MRSIRAERPAEFWVALITAATVIVVMGVEQGILLAIILSLLVHTRHGYGPMNVVLVGHGGHLRPVPFSQAAQVEPGLVVYRFNHSMYYANAEQLAEQVLALAKWGRPVSWLCIDLLAVDDVDFSAAATLPRLAPGAGGAGDPAGVLPCERPGPRGAGSLGHHGAGGTGCILCLSG